MPGHTLQQRMPCPPKSPRATPKAAPPSLEAPALACGLFLRQRQNRRRCIEERHDSVQGHVVRSAPRGMQAQQPCEQVAEPPRIRPRELWLAAGQAGQLLRCSARRPPAAAAEEAAAPPSSAWRSPGSQVSTPRRAPAA